MTEDDLSVLSDHALGALLLKAVRALEFLKPSDQRVSQKLKNSAHRRGKYDEHCIVNLAALERAQMLAREVKRREKSMH